MSDTLGLSYPFDSGAVSQIRGWPFTDFFVVGEQVYGLAPDGIYAIGSDDDAGEAVSWRMAGPKTDGGSDTFKRLRRATVAGPTTDGVNLAVIYESGVTPPVEALGGGVFAIGSEGAGREMQWTLSGEGPAAITGVTIRSILLGMRRRG